VDDTATEAMHVQELELDENVIRQSSLAAAADDRAEEEVP